jgi:uncharacterized DUF497 family protein
MRIEFDPLKNKINIDERGLSFESVCDFDWSSSVITEDNRKDYPERRFIAIGYLYQRLHVLCFTPLNDGIRVISFRKARKNDKSKTIN